MKTYTAGLQNSVQTTYSNNGKTTLFGRTYQKTVNSQNVVSPTLTQWLDLFQTYALYPVDTYYNPNTGHLFVLAATSTTYSATNMYVMLFNFSSSTSWTPSYVGKVNLNFANSAASTPVIKGFEVYENGSNITPVITITGSVAIEGGKYIAYNLTTASFTVGGFTIFPASGSNQAGYMYFLQDPAALGVLHVATTAWGSALPQFSSNSGVNTKTWLANGALATPAMYSWDLSITPTVAGIVTNGVNSSTAYTTAATGVSTQCYFSMSGVNGYSSTLGEQVVLMAGTTAVPTPFTAWTVNTLQSTTNVYFTRDLQVVNNFTVPALSSGITATSTYTTGGVTFTASVLANSGATSILLSTTNTAGASIPSSGTLTIASGSGPTTITYSAVTPTVYFNLSATSGAAATAVTQSLSGFSMLRAFGISSSMFGLKTGTLTAITGGALVANTMNYCKPISSPANTTLQGVDCIAFQTTTALYAFKISDLTSLGTTWPSLVVAGIGNTGNGIDVTAIATTAGEYSGQGLSGELDQFIYLTNTSTFIVKPYKVPGTTFTAVFGGTTDSWYAGQSPVTIQIGLAAVTQLHTMGGWLFVSGQTTGQAGIVIADIGSDANFGFSGVVSPVLSINAGNAFKYINTIEQLFDYTDSMNFWVRSASTSTDASFSTATLPIGAPVSSGVTSNGWTCIKTEADLSLIPISVGPYFQICVTFDICTLDANTPAQLQDLVYTAVLPGESSDNWQLDNDNTTQGTGSPSYASWYLGTAYSSSVPTLYARVYDTSGNLLFSANTSTNPTVFQYSTNGGTSWTSLGTIPNTVGTRVRALVSPTPSGVAYPSLRES